MPNRANTIIVAVLGAAAMFAAIRITGRIQAETDNVDTPALSERESIWYSGYSEGLRVAADQFGNAR